MSICYQAVYGQRLKADGTVRLKNKRLNNKIIHKLSIFYFLWEVVTSRVSTGLEFGTSDNEILSPGVPFVRLTLIRQVACLLLLNRKPRLNFCQDP